MNKKTEKSKKKEVAKDVVVDESKLNDSKLITAKLNEILTLIKPKKDGSGNSAMVCLIYDGKGSHVALSGKFEDAAVLVATAMHGSKDVEAVISNGYMMSSMKKKDVLKNGIEDAVIVEDEVKTDKK